MSAAGLSSDEGFAVARNGSLLLRTATDTPAQAMGNGLVLIFGAEATMVDWSSPDLIEAAWKRCVDRSTDFLDIVPVQVILRPERLEQAA